MIAIELNAVYRKRRKAVLSARYAERCEAFPQPCKRMPRDRKERPQPRGRRAARRNRRGSGRSSSEATPDENEDSLWSCDLKLRSRPVPSVRRAFRSHDRIPRNRRTRRPRDPHADQIGFRHKRRKQVRYAYHPQIGALYEGFVPFTNARIASSR